MIFSPFWMALVFVVVRRVVAFSSPIWPCSRCTNRPLLAMRSHSHLLCSKNGTTVDMGTQESDVSWLSGNDHKRPYRLAYRHILPSPVSSASDDDCNEWSNHRYDHTDTNQTENIIGNYPQTTILFCNGFRSVLSGGTKALALERHCQQKGWEFCSFDYRGHGLSSGNFSDFVLSDWIDDASLILERVLWRSSPRQTDQLPNKPVIIVGSSMGAWISIHLALRYNNRQHSHSRQPIGGILGVAAAPDFLQDLYAASSPDQRADWKETGVASFSSRYSEYPYPISWPLMKDAIDHWGILPSTQQKLSLATQLDPEILARTTETTNKFTSKKNNVTSTIPVCCQVRLIHGKHDEDIPQEKSVELSDILTHESAGSRGGHDDDVVLIQVEDGDHRLSRPQDIHLLLDTLDSMVIDREGMIV